MMSAAGKMFKNNGQKDERKNAGQREERQYRVGDEQGLGRQQQADLGAQYQQAPRSQQFDDQLGASQHLGAQQMGAQQMGAQQRELGAMGQEPITNMQANSRQQQDPYLQLDEHQQRGANGASQRRQQGSW